MIELYRQYHHWSTPHVCHLTQPKHFEGCHASASNAHTGALEAHRADAGIFLAQVKLNYLFVCLSVAMSPELSSHLILTKLSSDPRVNIWTFSEVRPKISHHHMQESRDQIVHQSKCNKYPCKINNSYWKTLNRSIANRSK